MKKLVVVSTIVFGMSLISSCETPDNNEQTEGLDQLEVYQVDPDEIERPGEQGGDQD